LKFKEKTPNVLNKSETIMGKESTMLIFNGGKSVENG